MHFFNFPPFFGGICLYKETGHDLILGGKGIGMIFKVDGGNSWSQKWCIMHRSKPHNSTGTVVLVWWGGGGVWGGCTHLRMSFFWKCSLKWSDFFPGTFHHVNPNIFRGWVQYCGEKKKACSMPTGAGARTRARRGSPAARHGSCSDKQASLSMPIDRVGWLHNTMYCVFWRYM